MLRKKHKRVVAIVFGLAAVALLIVNSFLIWVMTGPRSLSYITPIIENSLVPAGSDYKVDIENTMLYWDGWNNPVSVKAIKLNVYSPEGQVFASFPEVTLRLSTSHLLFGKIQPRVLEVSNPMISFYQNSDGTIALGFEEKEGSVTAGFDLPAALMALSEDDTGIRTLLIHKASLSLGNKELGMFLTSPNTEIAIRRSLKGFDGNLVMDLMFEQESARIDVDFSVPVREKLVRADVSFSNISPQMIKRLKPQMPWIDKTNMPAFGWVSAVVGWDWKVHSLDTEIEAGPGTVTDLDQFDEPINIKHLKLEASATEDFRTIDIKDGSIEFDQPSATFSGAIRKEGEAYGIELQAKGQNMPIDILHRFWPKTLAPKSREWVTTSITKGTVPEAWVTLKFKPGEIDLSQVPDEAVEAEIQVKNAMVQYLPNHPKVTDVSGLVRFTGQTMRVEANSGKYLSGSEVKSAIVTSPNLDAIDTRIVTELDIAAPARDAATFLGLPRLGQAKDLGLDPETAKGSATGKVKLDFIAFSETPGKAEASDMIFDVAVNLDGAGQKGFMGDKDIENATGSLEVDNKGIRYNGKLSINTVPMTMKLKSGFKKTDPSEYTIQAQMPAAKLPSFGYGKLDFLKGTLGLDATFLEEGDKQTTQGNVDLTKATLDFADFGLKKPEGEKASLNFTAESDAAGNTNLSKLEIKGDTIKVNGSAVVSKKTGELASFKASNVVFGKNNLSVDYQANGMALTLKGKTLDLAPYLSTGDSEFSTSHIKDIKADVDMEQVLLKDNHVLNEVKAKIDCAKSRCQSADIKMLLAGKIPFTYRIYKEGGKRKLQAATDDAGELIRALGIFENMAGGKLALEGVFYDDQPNAPLEGLLTINKYSLSNAPVLTKILTIASLTGILETLSGNGIMFTKMKVPFTFADDVVKMKGARTFGASIGITADGTIALKDTELNLEGAIVPAYALNTILGNIPLIGMLAGGKKGLIAVNYSVKGPYKDPNISVNPLSMLTPGFLRNIFDVGSSDEPKSANDNKKEEKPKAKATGSSKKLPSNSSIRPKGNCGRAHC